MVDERPEIPRVKELIRSFLDAQKEVLCVWARWSLSTKVEGPWRCFLRPEVRQGSGEPEVPPEISDHDRSFEIQNPVHLTWLNRGTAGVAEPMFSRISVRWVSVVTLPARLRLAAGFEEENPSEGLEPLRQFGKQVLQLLQEIRREREAQRLLALPTASANLEDAQARLRELATAVAECLDADGAKLYLVRRGSTAPVLERFTNTHPSETSPKAVPYSPDRGLADYVLRKKTWLLIPQCAQPQVDGPVEEGVEHEGKDGRGRQFRVRARRGTEIDPGAVDPDNESSMLTYPLETDAKVTGAVTVWRVRSNSDPLPFEETLDVESLKNSAKHLAAACQRVLLLQKAEQQLAELRTVVQKMAEATSLHQGYKAVAEGAGRLGDAACSVLLHYEAGKHGGFLYESATWKPAQKQSSQGDDTELSAQQDQDRQPVHHPQAEEGYQEKKAAARDPLIVRCSMEHKTWSSQVKETWGRQLAPLEFRELIIASHEGSSGQPPHLALALFDPPPPPKSPAYFSDELLEYFSRAFFQAAAGFLHGYTSDLASRVIDQLSGPPAEQPEALRSREGLLEQAAQLLKDATNADQVLIYTGSPHNLEVRQSVPAAPALHGIRVASGSQTEKAVVDHTPLRLLAFHEAPKMLDKKVLDGIKKGLGWESVRSWLAYPLRHEKRVLGLFKLLTNGQGHFLGEDHLVLVDLVSRQAAWEIYKAARQSNLEHLLALLEEKKVDQVHGNPLGEALVDLLKQWAQRVLFKPEAQVLILARSQRGRTLVKAGGAPALRDEMEKEFQSLMDLQGNQVATLWGREEVGILKRFAPYGIRVDLGRFGDQRVRGFLFLGDQQEFTPDDREPLEEASRLLAVLLSLERERNEIKEIVGRFRHAALAPVQGVVSAAKLLAELAMEAGITAAEIQPSLEQLLLDAEALSLWRQNQRFYLSDEVTLKKRPRVPLKPLIERCFARYRDLAELRQLDYRLSWLPKGELQLPLDEQALDLAFSNLLDNAVKYAYHQRSVTVGAQVLGDWIHLWVEDVGHSVNPGEVEHILEFGGREERDDPFRVIPGQGLGLYLAHQIIVAHGGKLQVQSEKAGVGVREETTPYRVRFTILLPTFRRGEVR